MAITRPANVRGFAVSSAGANRWLIFFCFFAIYIIWGSTYLAIRYAVETIPPLYTAGMRHLVAGSILLAWCAAKKLRPTREQLRASVVIGFLFFLIGHGSLHWAEQVVPSGRAALLIAIEPIIVFLMASAAAKTWRWNGMLAAGILLGLAGVGVLVQGTISAPPVAGAVSGFGSGWGTLAVLLGATSWSAGIIYSRRSHLSGNPLLLSALSLLAGAVMLLAAGTVFGEYRGFSIYQVSTRSWMALGYLIVFGSVIAFTAYNWLLEHYSPTLVATHTYVNPIVAVLLGWAYADESVTLQVALAAIMVVGAVVLVDRGTSQIQKADKQSAREQVPELV